MRSTSRSMSDISSVVLIRACCGWVCDHSRAPLDCGGRAQRRHRFSTGDRASKAAWRFASRRSPKKFSCSYVALYSLCFLAILGALILSSIASYAEDLTTLDGKTFTNITEVAKYPKLVVFTYNSNRTSVTISNLPEEFLAKYGMPKPQSPPPQLTNVQPVDLSQQTVSATAQPIFQSTNPVDVFLVNHKDSSLEEKREDWVQIPGVKSNGRCSIRLTAKNFELEAFDPLLAGMDDPHAAISKISFTFGEDVALAQVFEKFIEWEDIARKNNTESFEKDIPYSVGKHTFTFYWKKDSLPGQEATLWFNLADDDDARYMREFSKEDIVKFRKYLEQLPALKQQLMQEIQNQEAQKNLFK